MMEVWCCQSHDGGVVLPVGTAHSEKEEEGGASPLRRRKKLLEVQRAHDSAD